MRPKNSTYGNLSDVQSQVVTGSMLGDGHISYNKFQTSCFSKNQQFLNKEYLEWMKLEMAPFSSGRLFEVWRSSVMKYVKQTIKQVKCKKHLSQYVFKTRRDPVFVDLEKCWYQRNEFGEHVLKLRGKIKERIKIVPSNLNLTPLSVAVWYADDGSNYPNRRHIVLCTDSFSKEEVEFLISKLEGFGIKSYIVKNRNHSRICVSSYSYLDFINLVKPYFKWDCLKYKVDLTEYSPSSFNPSLRQSGYPGVNWIESHQRWHVRIKRKGKTKYLGVYRDLQEAINVRVMAEENYEDRFNIR